MNTRLKILIGILVAVIVIAVVVHGWAGTLSSPSDMASTTSETATTTTTGPTTKGYVKGTTAGNTSTTPKPATPAGTTPAPEILWKFAGQNTGGSASQQSMEVILTADGNEYDLGTFIGTCKTIADEDLKGGANQISGVLCLMGDQGTEIAIVRSGNSYLVQKGDVTIGDAAHPGKRGPFVTVATLKK